MSKITIYIASHNYGKFLGEAIESVLRQSYDDWELLVIDDNSTDNTPDVMKFYAGDPRVRLFRTPGVGLPALCNLALAESKGEYLIRLDGDDLFDENILLVLAAHLERHSDVGLVFPDYYLIDEFGEVFAQERREKLLERNHVLDMPPNGACTLIRKSLLVALGGYREDLFAQDGFDLWSKIKSTRKFANVNLPLFYYRRHDQNLTNNSHKILHARQQIKQDSILVKISSFKPLIAVIPCRRNYDFCRNLWKVDLNGKCLLQRKIELCLKSIIFDYIVVACDNPDAQGVISHYKDPRLRFYLRRTEDTLRSVGIVATLEKIAAIFDPEAQGITALSYVPAPFVTSNSVEEAIHTLISNETDSSMGVEEIRDPLFRRAAHGLTPINPPRAFSSDFDLIYREANIAFATRNKNFRRGSLTGPSMVHFIVSAEECFFIDSEKKLEIAKILDRKNGIRGNRRSAQRVSPVASLAGRADDRFPAPSHPRFEAGR